MNVVQFLAGSIVWFFMTKLASPCSPPLEEKHQVRLRPMGVLKRARRADIVLVGTVLGLFDDRHRDRKRKAPWLQMANIAVQCEVKGFVRGRLINVQGFGSDLKNGGDCTRTDVKRYGTYLFFLRENRYGQYVIDEVNLESGAVEIPCRNSLPQDVRRTIEKYGNRRKKVCRCSKWRRRLCNCYRPRTLMRAIHRFKHSSISPRKLYCHSARYDRNSSWIAVDSTSEIRDVNLLADSSEGLFAKGKAADRFGDQSRLHYNDSTSLTFLPTNAYSSKRRQQHSVPLPNASGRPKLQLHCILIAFGIAFAQRLELT